MSAADPNAQKPEPAVVPQKLEPHQFASIFPPMSDDELKAMSEDIKAGGLKDPVIWLYEGKVLDGNNRVRACKAAFREKELRFEQFDSKKQGDPLNFVVSRNLHRRHLNESQRGAIAATLVDTKLGSNQYNRAGMTEEAAAKLLGVSVTTVKDAKEVVKKADPEVIKKVQDGKVRLNAVKAVLNEPKENQATKLKEIADRKAANKKAAAAAKAAANKEPEANAKMTALDDFKKKWSSFDEMQRRAFVTWFEKDLAELIDEIREQREMIGGEEGSRIQLSSTSEKAA
jgi:ParB-like chromosome segregation protein Spo0J